MPIRQGSLQTFTLPNTGGQAIRIATGSLVPTRVVVRNVAPGPAVGFLFPEALIAYDPNSLNALPAGGGSPGGGNLYRLPIGGADVYVLAPDQQLYAMGNGGASPIVISVAVSDAYPVRA